MNIARPLLAWYRRNARTFPWRTSPVDPYVVLVSEVMLQQTQAARVALALPPFLQAYPTVFDLAAATNAQIVRAWQGMGYNSRALRLRDAARKIRDEFGGTIPNSVDLLRVLPGIGPYTAAAVACFAYGRRTIVLDVNIRRVYSRLMEKQNTTVDIAPDNELNMFAQRVIPRNTAEWHHAVMDLGATICVATAPRCAECPLQTICPSAHSLINVRRKRATEPSLRGVPRRLWRGRIVEVLRTIPGAIGISKLLEQVVQSPLSKDERAWFADVLYQLERDGLITRTNSRVRLQE